MTPPSTINTRWDDFHTQTSNEHPEQARQAQW